MSCAFAEGRYLRRYPQCFTNSSGAVAGIVGGIGTVGGMIYPLAYSSTLFSSLHVGYTVVAVSMVHIVLLNTWVCRPKISHRAHVDGFFDWKTDAEISSGDD